MRPRARRLGRGRAGRLNATAELRTPRLRLTPLAVEDAVEMAAVLADPALYRFTGGEPPSPADLERRYRAQAAGRSPDGTEAWHNWIVRLADDGAAVGFVQATVTDLGAVADVAWVIGTAWQGRGFAVEAAAAMLGWLRAQGIGAITAHVHPDHAASAAVARRIGLAPTDRSEDGERVWETPIREG